MKLWSVAFSKAPGREPTAFAQTIIRRSHAAQYCMKVKSSPACAAVNACLPFMAGSEDMMMSTSLEVSRLSHSLKYFWQVSLEVRLVMVHLHPFNSHDRSSQAWAEQECWFWCPFWRGTQETSAGFPSTI